MTSNEIGSLCTVLASTMTQHLLDRGTSPPDRTPIALVALAVLFEQLAGTAPGHEEMRAVTWEAANRILGRMPARVQ